MVTKSTVETAPARREHVRHTPSDVFTFTISDSADSVTDSADVFDEDGIQLDAKQVPGYPQMRYMPFGHDNQLPYRLVNTIGSDEVLSQNLLDRKSVV